MDYRVELEAFHGPLDLLLFLVKKNEVDIFDIPIARIAEQFQEYLRVLQVADVEMAGEFLVMAATLMEIKSRLLLPSPPAGTSETEPDPRQELVRQLVEYKKLKEAAARLDARAGQSQQRLPRQPTPEPAGPAGLPAVQPVELWDLVSAFGRILSETQTLEAGRVITDDTPHEVYVEEVRAALTERERVAFRDLFTPPRHRARLVGLFLAILELIRNGEILLDVADDSTDITLRRAPPNPLTSPPEHPPSTTCPD
jgi:segregation and condensation protein A